MPLYKGKLCSNYSKRSDSGTDNYAVLLQVTTFRGLLHEI